MGRKKIIKYENLPITNNFMFCKVMSNEALCKEFLEVMLKIKIKKIKYINAEQEKSATVDSKSVRFDVYVEDEKRIFDIEMQMTNSKELSKRTRYYQSLIDIDCIDKGGHYKSLKESIIIFITKGDAFKARLPRYTFENICLENSKIKLNDKTQKIFYNINAYKDVRDDGVRNVLEYFKTGKQTDGITGKMQSLLEKARKNAKWRKSYMTLTAQRNFWEMDAREKGMREGLREGLRAGRKAGLQEGREKGLLDGKKQGAHDKAIDTARNLLIMKLSKNKIAKATGLPIEEVNALQTEMAV